MLDLPIERHARDRVAPGAWRVPFEDTEPVVEYRDGGEDGDNSEATGAKLGFGNEGGDQHKE